MGKLHEDVRRSLELATRLKLATDNAKNIAVSHQETLETVERRLAALEKRLSASSPNRSEALPRPMRKKARA
jgi:hypothetical protein